MRANWTCAKRLAAVAFLTLAGALPAAAADLVIGLLAVHTSADPHWATTARNADINQHIFEPLVRRSTEGSIGPWLAESWQLIDDTHWEFHLRKDVKWHDGSPFTADDVVFSYDRAPRVPGSPNPFTTFTKYFDKVEARDPYTIVITTKGPAPALLTDLAYLMIVSRKVGTTATTADYNSGKAAIGTGAYRFVSFAHNDKTVMKRNPDYWGEKEPWDTVTFKMMSNDAARTAALLAGDIDLIESVPPDQVERLKTDKRVAVWSKQTARIAYYATDIGEEVLASGRLVDMTGQPLKTNPFKDKRVRQALKLAIDLEQMTQRLLQGEATATGQYLVPGIFGFIPEIKPWKLDQARARKLLEEAGWADKFKVSIAASAEQFQGSVQTAQAIAQAWSRIGVQTDVVTMPYPTFLNLRNGRKLPVMLMARQNVPLIADGFYPVVVHSWGDVKGQDGLGSSNYSRYANDTVDDLIEKAMVTMDDNAREKMYQEVGRIALDDSQLTPLWLLNETTASKPTITFVPRLDRFMFAMNVRLKK